MRRTFLQRGDVDMNENLKYGLFFLGGAALGAIGAVAVSRGKLDLKPFAAETVRETMEDVVAEAQAVSEQRRARSEEA